MTVQWIAKVLELGPEISGARRMILMSLANHANTDGYAWPSRELIAAEAGLVRIKTVTEHLSWLEAEGYITREVNGWAGEHGEIPADERPNLYQLAAAWDAPPWEPGAYFVERKERARARRGYPDSARGATRIPPEAGVGIRPRGYPDSDPLTRIENPELEPSARNASDASASPSRRKAPVSGEDARRIAAATELAHHLADRIAESDPEALRPSVTKAWVTTMERIIRIDGRPPEKIRAAIDWVFTNPAGEFWIANVRSPQKLREQYDRLRRDAMRASKAEVKREVDLLAMSRAAQAKYWGPEPEALDVAEVATVATLPAPEPEVDRGGQLALLGVLRGIGGAL